MSGFATADLRKPILKIFAEAQKVGKQDYKQLTIVGPPEIDRVHRTFDAARKRTKKAKEARRVRRSLNVSVAREKAKKKRNNNIEHYRRTEAERKRKQRAAKRLEK